MSIYVKTTATTADLFAHYDSRNIKYFEKAFTDIPAHGDLVDRDVILQEFRKVINKNDRLAVAVYEMFSDVLAEAEVVIPADGGE